MARPTCYVCPAFDTTYHPHHSHRRSHPDGNLYRSDIVVCNGGLRHGIQVRHILRAHDLKVYLNEWHGFRCHLGKVAIYDTVTRLGWSVDIRTHGIKVMIEKLL